MARLSKDEVCERLGITRPTLERWMFTLKKIKFHTLPIGKKKFYTFDDKEVTRVEKERRKK